MVVEHAYLTIVAGQEAEFEAAYLRAAPVLAGAGGCQGADLHRDVEHPGRYLLRVEWSRLSDHVEGFPGSPAGKEFASHVAHFFDGPPEVRHFATEQVRG